MMKMLLITMLVCFSGTAAYVSCPANMHFESCASQCQQRCNQPMPLICTLACYIGCVCNEGYVLAEDNVCVLPENCPAVAAETNYDAIAAQPSTLEGATEVPYYIYK